MHSLQDFMISRVRVKIMELFFSNTEEMYYVREITRSTKEEINAVRRELDRMIGSGMLKSEKRGNRLYYYLNKKYTYFPELLRMVAKTTGIGLKMRKLRRKLGDISYLMFSGEFVNGQAPKRDQVDILVIGKLVLPELGLLIKEQEKKIGREINYTVFDEEEFEFRKTRRDPFIMDILYGTRVMVIGGEEDFCKREIPGI
ncbi:MAG: hypothetical protein ABFQ62_04120 [Patescibacteria group bacterium]